MLTLIHLLPTSGLRPGHPLTWRSNTIRQGQEWGVQGPTGVSQNRVPVVNEGHGLRVATTLLETRDQGESRSVRNRDFAINPNTFGSFTYFSLTTASSNKPECP